MAKKRSILRTAVIAVFAFLIFMALVFGLGYYEFREITRDLPTIDPLAHYHPKQTSRVYSSEGILIGEFHDEENRIAVPLDRIPRHVRDAFIAAEDQNFYEHRGVDWKAILRAFWKNIRAGRITQGGSTITQQVVKALVARDSERSLRRKIREAVLAYRVEQRFSKSAILEIYLNNLYLGDGAYGITAAAKVYFGKDVRDLTLAESAMLAGLGTAPSRDSPRKNFGRALSRQHYVLRRLAEIKKISWQDYEKLSAASIRIQPRRNINLETAPYFVEMVRQDLVNRYGNEQVLTSGWKIKTTLQIQAQKAANEATHDGLQKLRQKFEDARSPIQGALIAADLRNGAVRALVGGYNFKVSEFNRAIQARRQAGSAIKPLIFAAALENGFHEMSIVEDAPITLQVIGGSWSPQNYKKGEFLGPITLRTAFAKSINTVSVRLVVALGLSTVIDFLARLGITSQIPFHISLALGTVDVALSELMQVYAVFPRLGQETNFYYIEEVRDSNDKILESRALEAETSKLSPQAAYIIVDLMKAVTKFGTGRRARNFSRPIGGKTGTSTNFRDAWFVGFSHDLIAGVWVGRDDFTPIGDDATGGKIALPIWLEFMENGHPPTVVKDFDMPPGIIFWPVDPGTGEVLDFDDSRGEFLPFIQGVEPTLKNQDYEVGDHSEVQE